MSQKKEEEGFGPAFTKEQANYVIDRGITELFVLGKASGKDPVECVQMWREMGMAAVANGCILIGAIFLGASSELHRRIEQVEQGKQGLAVQAAEPPPPSQVN